MKTADKMIKKVEYYLDVYKQDGSIYYKELKKIYTEYKNSYLPDKITNDLYLQHMDKLCHMLKQRKYANVSIALITVFCILISILAGYSIYKYASLSEDIKNGMLKYNRSTSLEVKYENIDNFEASILEEKESYKDLDPLKLKIKAVSKSKDKYKVHYDVYIVEDNISLPKENRLPKEALLYNASSTFKDSGIRNLGSSPTKGAKIYLFSGETEVNKEEIISIRMWIDRNTQVENLNKKFKFKINVEGYAI